MSKKSDTSTDIDDTSTDIDHVNTHEGFANPDPSLDTNTSGFPEDPDRPGHQDPSKVTATVVSDDDSKPDEEAIREAHPEWFSDISATDPHGENPEDPSAKSSAKSSKSGPAGTPRG